MGLQPASFTLMVGGCFILFCNWLFFNAGSSGSITQGKDEGNNPMLSIFNTIISTVGAATAVSTMNMSKTSWTINQSNDVTLKFDLIQIVGSIMSGCVAGTASCNNIHLSSAFIIGIVSAVIY